MAHLPDGADEDAVVAQALRRSVGLYGMAPFRAARVPASTAASVIAARYSLVRRALSASLIPAGKSLTGPK